MEPEEFVPAANASKFRLRHKTPPHPTDRLMVWLSAGLMVVMLLVVAVVLWSRLTGGSKKNPPAAGRIERLA